jgi:exodeoxyribonuclease VII large subunit
MAELVHPDRPLGLGFARVTSRDGATLTRASDAVSARLLTLHFGDGAVDAAVGEAGDRPTVERKRAKPYIAPQPGLFDAAEE